MDEQSLVLLGILLLAGIVLVLWTWRTRRKELGPTYERTSRARSRKVPGDAEADTLVEVEVYLAFGRKPEAISILEKALKSDPSRERLRKKLQELKAAN